MSCFNQGDIIWLSLQPTRGHEQTGRRPVLVVSSSFYNRMSGMTMVCPITSTKRNYPSRIELPDGLPVSGYCECEQTRFVDVKERNPEFICSAPRNTLEQVSNFLISVLIPE